MPEQITFEPLPFDEAIAAFGGRVVIGPDAYRALSEESRSFAFTMSKVSDLRLIKDTKEELQKAIEEGGTFADFKAGFADLPAAIGFAGNARYLETVFLNAVQGSYQAGRWEQQQAVKADRPFLSYFTVGDDRVRPHHAALHGVTLPADHARWAEIYPPNGHR